MRIFSRADIICTVCRRRGDATTVLRAQTAGWQRDRRRQLGDDRYVKWIVVARIGLPCAINSTERSDVGDAGAWDIAPDGHWASHHVGRGTSPIEARGMTPIH